MVDIASPPQSALSSGHRHSSMTYQPHIDGLRTISVLIVILFHLDVPGFSGGFFGVDIFFVISGFLITGIIRSEIAAGSFTIQEFYRRRIFRIVPALVVLLILVLPAGFVLDSQVDFDFLGRQVFFAALGLSNILFATRVDYFAAETPQLVHTWSLGVEEQFYVFFPIIMIALSRWARRLILPILLLALVGLSLLPMTEDDPIRRYFLPQYRAFELMVGALLTFAPMEIRRISPLTPILGAVIIALSLMVITPETPFPGPMTWLPLIGAAMIIVSRNDSLVLRGLSHPAMVHVGLISYPLYLVHQPLIYYMHRLDLSLNPIVFGSVAIGLSYLLALGVNLVVERPFRRMRRASVRVRNIIAASLVAMLVALAGMGYHVARNDGWPWRFDVFNPFAAEVATANIFSFDKVFRPGFVTGPESTKRLLVIGDSVGQQYAYPAAQALGVAPSAVDAATRNGCVMTKGVIFREIVSEVSCNGVRDQLYADDTRYDVILMTQYWRSETQARRVLNFPPDRESRTVSAWEDFLRQSLDALSPRAGVVVVLGWHPVARMNREAMAPSTFLSRERYLVAMRAMYFDNSAEMESQNAAFRAIARDYPNVVIINPFEIFCDGEGLGNCTLHDEALSYFRDPIHINMHATDFVAERLKRLIDRAVADLPPVAAP